MTGIYKEDCRELMKRMEPNSVDLVVTSPPYDDLREYNNSSSWNMDVFKDIANGLYRVMKEGGVVVWVVNDCTENCSESLNSFREALYFNEIGFNLNDTMIWNKPNPIPQTKQPRYTQCFEYMFVFSKGVPKTFNPIQRVCKNGGKVIKSSLKQITTGKIERKEKTYTSSESISEYNIWEIPVAQNTTDHPAVYPIELVKKHILSWSNPGDLVFDPFLGSGTTGIAAKQLDREFVGTEIDDQYFEIAKERINNAFGNYDAKEKESSIKTLF